MDRFKERCPVVVIVAELGITKHVERNHVIWLNSSVHGTSFLGVILPRVETTRCIAMTAQSTSRITTDIHLLLLKPSHFSSPARSANLKNLHVLYMVNNNDKKFIRGAAIANRHLRVSVVRTPSSSYSLKTAAATIIAMPRAHSEKFRRLLLRYFEMDLGERASGSAPFSMVIEVEDVSLSRVVPGSVPLGGSDGVGAGLSVSLLEGYRLRSVSVRVSTQPIYRIRI